MYDLMRDHAIKTVWCSPEQDNQMILAAQRITKKGGAFVSFPIMMRQTDLPRADRYYHVYEIGQAIPTLLGLLSEDPDWVIRRWVKFSDAVNTLPLFCDIYTDAGVHIPLYQSYYMFTEDRALIFCVEINNKLPIDFDADRAYLRVYTNAYYDSAEAGNIAGDTKTLGLTALSTANISAMTTTVNAWKTEGGATYCYVNGQLKDKIDASTAKIGDLLEVVQDLSVKRVVDFQANTLFSFDSELDSCFKYLLHYPETTDEVIDYVDDIDVYLIDKTDPQYTGRYIHKNQGKTFRMVTHRDYSLSVDVFQNVAEGLKAFLADNALDIRNFYVRLYIRNSGFNRPLVYDNNRLFELYKLPDDKVKQALVGMDASVPFLSAAVLEKSAFITLLRTPYRQIDIGLIQEAFGYNAIAKYLGDSPIRGIPHGEYKMFTLPPGMIKNSTVFEYDADGLLIGYYYNAYGDGYISRNKACDLIEVISGKGGKVQSVSYGTNNLYIPPGYSYRVYKTYLNETGFPVDDWEDVTGSDQYTVANNNLTWLSPETDFMVMVRSDESFLCYDLELNSVAGTVYFDLSETSGGLDRLMPVPMGDLDIWLNGHSCIHQLDVFVDFPRVYIVNKDYLVQPAGSEIQKVTVRFTGFAEGTGKELHPSVIEDFGFIVHGVMSNNSKFNLRDDKVLRITVKGALKHREDVVFSEEHEGVSVINAINGLPYQVKEVIIPLKEMTSDETYALRQKSLVIDKAVSDYLTVKLPQPPRDAVSAMHNRHRLVSPFFSHLINDLASGQFDKSTIQKELSDNDVLEVCRPYTHLMKFDPISETNGVDQRFVVVHPHQLETTIELDHYSYVFIKRVVKLYGRGLIVLAQHLTLNTSGG